MNTTQLLAKPPSWVVLVAGLLGIGATLGLLSWVVRAVFPGIDQDVVFLGSFFLGMAAGGVGMPWLLFWSMERKACR